MNQKKNPNLDALKKDPQAAKLLNNPKALKSLLSAPETQTLVNLLNQKAGGGLQDAAQAAAQGKPDALIGILNQVMQSTQGAETISELQKKAQK
mgnify:CR=1 FL=1